MIFGFPAAVTALQGNASNTTDTNAALEKPCKTFAQKIFTFNKTNS
jgi:hypothetical protein